MINNIPKITILTLLFISMLTTMSNVAIVTALPSLKEHFHNINNIEFLSKLMITLPSFSIAFLAPFLGLFVNKVGKKTSVLIALILFVISGSSGLYLNSIKSLLLSRLLLGVSVAVLMIVSTTLIGDYFKDELRHKFLGFQGLFISIGGVIFVTGGGFLSDINWRYSFAIYLIGLLLIPLVKSFLIEINDNKIEENNEENTNSNIIYIYILAFILMVIFYILPTQMPFLMMNHFGASGTMTGSIIATAFASNAIGAMMFRRLKSRFSFAQIYIIGMFIIAIGFICISLVTDVKFFFLTSPILGFGGGILIPNMTTWMLAKTKPARRIHSSAYLTSSMFLGQFFSPILFQPIVNKFGIENFFNIIGLALTTIILIFAINRSIKLVKF